jgi:pre-mRNA-splicing factor ATP-dependent RNA helicase DHX16
MYTSAQQRPGLGPVHCTLYRSLCLHWSRTHTCLPAASQVHIHPGSSLRESLPRWVVYHELVLTSKEYMRTVSEIRPEWLVEIAPHYYSKNDILEEGRKMPKGKGRAAVTEAK